MTTVLVTIIPVYIIGLTVLMKIELYATLYMLLNSNVCVQRCDFATTDLSTTSTCTWYYQQLCMHVSALFTTSGSRADEAIAGSSISTYISRSSSLESVCKLKHFTQVMHVQLIVKLGG